MKRYEVEPVMVLAFFVSTFQTIIFNTPVQ